MIGIRLEGITKSYRGDPILEGLDLSIEEGKFFALLGPSGCGKTTLLRLIAGFESVDSGTIYLGGVDITTTPINQRNVNTVFQNYALFPHLNVFDNVAYGLRVRNFSKDLIDQKVFKVLETVRLDAQAHRFVHELSGGQQQRVALARAIVNEPDVLLLDEPLAALDFNLREKMLLELIEIQENFRTTFVYVTHDATEALTVADQMAIMSHGGQIEQVGDPKDIYEFPQTVFVVRFVGAANIVHGAIVHLEGQPFLKAPELGTIAITIPSENTWAVAGSLAFLSIRPEKIALYKTQMEGFSNRVEGTVSAVAYQGRSTQYKVRVGTTQIQVFEQNEEHFIQEEINVDDKVYLHWQKDNAVLVRK